MRPELSRSLLPIPLVVLAALLCAPTTLAAQQPPTGGVQEEELEPPPPVDERSPQEVEAEQAYADGNLRLAASLYKQLALEQSVPTERARLLLLSSWLAFQLGDQTNARNDLENALFADPATPFEADLYSPDYVTIYQDALRSASERRQREGEDRLKRGAAAVAASRWGEARPLLEEGLRFVPNDPTGVLNLALVEARIGSEDAALAGFERVLALERGNPRGVSPALKGAALQNAAAIYLRREQLADAENALSESVKLDPENAQSWFLLGQTRARLGKSDQAIEALRKAQILDPENVDLQSQLADFHLSRGEWLEALSLLVPATQARPESPQLWIQHGRAQRGLGNIAGAAESFRKAINLDPGDRNGNAEPAALLLAQTMLDNREPAAAEAAATQATRWRPEKAAGWRMLALARQANGDLPGARESIERAAEIEPQNLEVLLTLGSVRLSTRDLSAAAEAYRQALAVDASSTEAATQLAQLEARLAAQTPGAKGAPTDPRALIGARMVPFDTPTLGIRGLRVDNVGTGSRAAKAGLKVGDLVLRVDGKPIDSVEKLMSALASKSSVKLDVLRRGSSLEVVLPLN
ncbi:MAG: tetratricopeptide repeat protein [Holophagales bacterium]|nr:tetratricopeptide repeat protein [Holophagales bacterium]